MQAIISRSMVPVLLLAGGVVSFVYGTWFHDVPVTRDVIKQVKEKVTYDREITLRDELKKLADDPNMPWHIRDDARQKLDTLREELLSEVVGTEPATRTDTKDVTEKITKREREPTLILELTGRGFDVLASGGLKWKVPRDLRPNRPDQPAAAGICET